MQTKKQLILSHFQKKDLLTLKNADYRKCVDNLFQWLTRNDHTENDITTDQLGLKGKQTAHIKAKENFIVAGMEEVVILLENKSHLSFTPHIQDGQQATAHEVIAEMTGEVKEILSLERTILNVLQRMSGIATQTNQFIQSVNAKLSKVNSPIFIAATRKTPWMMLDKKAVAVGGGLTHRLSLSDAILIKDNHIKAVGSLKKSLDRMLGNARNTLVEVEVGTKKEAYTVLQSYFSYPSSNTFTSFALTKHMSFRAERSAVEESTKFYRGRSLHSVDASTSVGMTNNAKLVTLCVMLDNFSPAKAQQTIQMVKRRFNCSRVIFEASGRINDSNINKWARTGADILSVGTLTHSARSADIALQIISRKTL